MYWWDPLLCIGKDNFIQFHLQQNLSWKTTPLTIEIWSLKTVQVVSSDRFKYAEMYDLSGSNM